MQIRKAKQSDLKQILQLSQTLLHLDIPNFKWDKEEYIYRGMSEGQYFVADDSHKVCGFIQLIKYEKHLQLETMAVVVKHKGTGKKLVNFAVELARSQGKNQVKVSSYEEYDVLPFYKKMGFKQTRPGMANGMKYFNLILNV